MLFQRTVAVNLDVADANATAAGGFQQVQTAQEGGLARAAGADDGNHFTGVDGKVDTGQYGLAVELLGQVLYDDHALRTPGRAG